MSTPPPNSHPIKIDAYKWLWKLRIGIRRGKFPLDMLRYDNCWPYTPADVVGMTTHCGDLAATSVTVCSYSQLKTICPFRLERWKSFFSPGDITLEVL